MHYKKLLGLLGASATILVGCSTGFNPATEIEVLEYGPPVLESEQESTENNNITVEEPDFNSESELEVDLYGVFSEVDEDTYPELPPKEVVCDYGVVVVTVEEPNYDDLEEEVLPEKPKKKDKKDSDMYLDSESETMMYGPAPDREFKPEDEEVRAMYGVEPDRGNLPQQPTEGEFIPGLEENVAMYGVEPDKRELVQAPIEDTEEPEQEVIVEPELMPEQEVIRMMYGVAPTN